MVGPNITDPRGFMKSSQKGLETIPCCHWDFVDGKRYVSSDETLRVQ